MFSSNEKISGRQAFRLLVFDLLGLGTLLIPAAVAGFCGRDGIFCIIVGTVLGLLFLRLLVYAVGDMQGSFAEYTEKMCGTFFGKTIQAGYFLYLMLLAGYTAYLFSVTVLNNLLRGESFYLVLVLILHLHQMRSSSDLTSVRIRLQNLLQIKKTQISVSTKSSTMQLRMQRQP